MGEAPEEKRMAVGAGGAISQNIKRDCLPPGTWDVKGRKMVNIQIINSLCFEKLTGILVPPTPLGLDMYQKFNIPFFHYYLEDTEAVSGNVEDISGIDEMEKKATEFKQIKVKPVSQSWTDSSDVCTQCREELPYRL